MTLPVGVEVRPLDVHRDSRGEFSEVFRSSWFPKRLPVQWNAVRSNSGTVRGVHVHIVHSDYFILVDGSATIGVKDLRKKSPTYKLSTPIFVRGSEPALLIIPRGVAHGFAFHENSIHFYSVTHYWNPKDELGCLWNDLELGIHWPEIHDLKLSERDEKAQSFKALISELEPHQQALYEPTPGIPAPSPTRTQAR